MLQVKRGDFIVRFASEYQEIPQPTECKDPWSDFDFCFEEIKKDALNLEFVKRKTLQMCKVAVKQNGMALKFVPRKFRNKMVCVAAVKQNKEALQFVPPIHHAQCVMQISLEQMEKLNLN